MLERKWLRLRYQLKSIIGQAPKRVAFLHIPKCGGTTVFQHFKTNIGGGRSGKIAQFDSVNFSTLDDKTLERSRRARFVSGHFGWTALTKTSADAFRFTVLREPYDRLVSLYKFSRAKQHSDNPIFSAVFEAAKQRSFEDFCLSKEPELKTLIDNAMTRALADDYYPYSPPEPRYVLHWAKQHVDQLDLVIDLADLDDTLPTLAKITGTKLARRRQWRNKTPDAPVKVLPRSEFESDEGLMRVIAQDCMLYRHVFPNRSKTSLQFAANNWDSAPKRTAAH
ncbi:sulfotransferase family 2 domain-containing protein [Candidatus Viadribacter manganicus]|uniref:Sulfotransferase family protein n=1 Tax=Candidatus Viadribacter manganicus TaxID=1759059 RepID=A0A1B1AIK5_9PROT|nr:sulfotransferase family 2 domain-containing protein [Candidatus Viadribacter manganicus]ANP46392.1 hypothetical protein ATE48_10925 [Candidatus Viadribacter manganicus]